MVVTAIKQSSPDRLTVEFDGGETLVSTLGAVTDARLYVGLELDEEAFGELKRSSSKALDRQKALEILSRRPYSRRELKDKLLRRGTDEQSAEECIQWLSERGFLDDEEYAGAVARHYAAKGYGAGRVKTELRRRGIERELSDETLAALPENTEKIDAYIARRLRDPSDRDSVRKISAALFRRGYSWDEIRAALRRFDTETEED
ncbi:MAG: regulatory protein RecX [Oscillospiraceae bacterium]|nr:regulatory protein RecX [Oscillospiraceae bacterium]